MITSELADIDDLLKSIFTGNWQTIRRAFLLMREVLTVRENG